MVLPPSDAGAGREIAQGRWNGQEVDYLPRRLVVKLRPPDPDAETAVSQTVRAAALADAVDGITGVGRSASPTGRVVLRVADGVDALALAREMSERADVEFAEPDVVDHAALSPNDPRFPEQYGPTLVGAQQAWDLGVGQAGVLIGIIDSGISMTTADVLDHPDLADAARITFGTDFVDGGAPRDLNGHGTHVAGIAAAVGDNGSGVAGMNWQSPVYICRTLDAAGNGSGADFADAVEEITDFAVATGRKAVINYSGGGADSQTKRDACQYASDHGMILCAATGNDFAGPVISPALHSTTIPGVIAVGSTTSSDTVSNFSNVGPEVTVVAPGSAILSTMPTYAVTLNVGLNFGFLDGTSMATPLVTGLVALMWSRDTGASNATVKQRLIDSAVNLGPGQFDNAWGHGRVDANAAVRSMRPIVLPVSRIPVLCQPQSRITICLPSRLQVTCVPVTRLGGGCPPLPSRLPVLCQPSDLGIGCGPVSRFCPSVIDACPSQLVCGPEIEPEFPSGAAGAEAGGAPAGQEVWRDQGGRYFWVDENGGYHEWTR